jgi:hypothetical protein
MPGVPISSSSLRWAALWREYVYSTVFLVSMSVLRMIHTTEAGSSHPRYLPRHDLLKGMRDEVIIISILVLIPVVREVRFLLTHYHISVGLTLTS